MGHSRRIWIGDRCYWADERSDGWVAVEVERHRGAVSPAGMVLNAGYRPVPRGRGPAGTFRTMAECHDATRRYVATHTAK